MAHQEWWIRMLLDVSRAFFDKPMTDFSILGIVFWRKRWMRKEETNILFLTNNLLSIMIEYIPNTKEWLLNTTIMSTNDYNFLLAMNAFN